MHQQPPTPSKSTTDAPAAGAHWTPQASCLTFGLRDGVLVHVHDVVSGLDCACVCASCGDRLVARKGAKKAHHFAHYRGADCALALQTALHLAGKAILMNSHRIQLPEDDFVFVAKDSLGNSYPVRETVPARYVDFDRIDEEKRLDDIVPDLIAHHKGRSLLIEIAVTHFIDHEKLTRIRNMGMACIEIDLSDFRVAWDWDSLQHAVVDALDHKTWIANPALRDRVTARARKLAAEKGSKLERAQAIAAQREEARQQRLRAEAEERARQRWLRGDVEIARQATLREAVRLEIEGRERAKEKARLEAEAAIARERRRIEEEKEQRFNNLRSYYAQEIAATVAPDCHQRQIREREADGRTRTLMDRVEKQLGTPIERMNPCLFMDVDPHAGMVYPHPVWQAAVIAFFHANAHLVFGLKSFLDPVWRWIEYTTMPSALLHQMHIFTAEEQERLPKPEACLEKFLLHLVNLEVLKAYAPRVSWVHPKATAHLPVRFLWNRASSCPIRAKDPTV